MRSVRSLDLKPGDIVRWSDNQTEKVVAVEPSVSITFDGMRPEDTIIYSPNQMFSVLEPGDWDPTMEEVVQ